MRSLRRSRERLPATWRLMTQWGDGLEKGPIFKVSWWEALLLILCTIHNREMGTYVSGNIFFGFVFLGKEAPRPLRLLALLVEILETELKIWTLEPPKHLHKFDEQYYMYVFCCQQGMSGMRNRTKIDLQFPWLRACRVLFIMEILLVIISRDLWMKKGKKLRRGRLHPRLHWRWFLFHGFTSEVCHIHNNHQSVESVVCV